MASPPDVGALLAAERSEVAAQVVSLQRTFDDVVAASELVATDDEHDPEGSTIAYERAQVSALLDRARTRLAELDEAVERFTAGTYGTCDVCEGPIGDARLEALPATTRCVACARGAQGIDHHSRPGSTASRVLRKSWSSQAIQSTRWMPRSAVTALARAKRSARSSGGGPSSTGSSL